MSAKKNIVILREMLEDGFESVTDLALGNAKDSMIAEVLKKKSGKCLIRKDIQNIKNKMFPSCSEMELKNF